MKECVARGVVRKIIAREPCRNSGGHSMALVSRSGCDLGMMSLVQVAHSRVRAEPLTLESLPWPPQYRLLSPRAISRATARRLTRILKKRSTGAAPMNPMNPTIIDPNIVPKINPNS